LTTPRLECSNAVQMTLRGELANAAVTAPPQDVIAEYTQGGTSIPVGSLPLVGGARQLSDRLLTAADNPFGTPDMDGHYKIDALGQAIRIGNCRIEGTLVIIDTPLIILTNGITWNCAGDPNAILVTDGTIRLEDVEPTLNESNISVNMNPVTSPYRGTESNNTTGDVYPTELRGVLYTTDDIEIGPLTDGSQLRIEGVMVSNNLTITGNVAIQNFDGILQTPPVPLADWIPMEFVRGTFRRVNVP
ncbi:MAG: hypothetical protein HKN47_16135, partial [Pirellulaceae bacterium]|nr:hypothetical protein [Pirellulaceae bacterium]